MDALELAEAKTATSNAILAAADCLDAVPGSREKSIVLTKLQEAALWLETIHV